VSCVVVVCRVVSSLLKFELLRGRTKAGPVMAHTSRFEVVIKGKGGHGSQPHVRFLFPFSSPSRRG
jgi:hypothetical protein